MSRICQLIVETVAPELGSASLAWTKVGLSKAVELLLDEDDMPFQSIIGELAHYPELKAAIRCILMEGMGLTYNAQRESIQQMQMYGLIRNDEGSVGMANRIFETVFYNLSLSGTEFKAECLFA